MLKASRFNRNMMFAMMGMGIILLIVVFGTLYYSFELQADRAAQPSATGDSIIIVENIDTAMTEIDY